MHGQNRSTHERRSATTVRPRPTPARQRPQPDPSPPKLDLNLVAPAAPTVLRSRNRPACIVEALFRQPNRYAPRFDLITGVSPPTRLLGRAPGRVLWLLHGAAADGIARRGRRVPAGPPDPLRGARQPEQRRARSRHRRLSPRVRVELGHGAAANAAH